MGFVKKMYTNVLVFFFIPYYLDITESWPWISILFMTQLW